MAGSSATITFSKIATPYTDTDDLIRVVIDWVADNGDGSVPQTDFDSDDSLDILDRFCVLGVTDPGAVAPTPNYDIEILDEYGVDVFGGNLTNRSATASEQAVPKIGSAYGGRLCAGIWTFKLTNNIVNSATGKCVLYFEG